jgi:uncharacterized phage infection (PIP) family protein YhgE
MDTSTHLRFAVSVLLLGMLAGCAAKKTAGPPLPPTQAPAASASPEPTPQPTPTPTTQQSQMPAQGTPPPEPEQSQPATANNDKKANNKHNGKKPAASGTRETARTSPPSKIVVKPDAEPPAGSGQISPGGNDVARGEPSTDQLLQTTENNLNNLKGELSSEEQAMVTRIRDFMSQSRQATKENDAIRAHTLANKAHLLCDDLIKRR